MGKNVSIILVSDLFTTYTYTVGFQYMTSVRKKLLYSFHMYAAIVFFASGLIMNMVQVILYLTLRQISKTWYRKINKYICASLYSRK